MECPLCRQSNIIVYIEYSLYFDNDVSS